MQTDNVYITEEKKKELSKELAYLKATKRKEIIESLEYAKSLGDLSENAEYHQAREEQGKLEDRIREIDTLLKDAQVVEKHHSNLVEIGTTVTIQKSGETAKKTFQIVGSQEADMTTGKLSNQSPIGQALSGRKKGDLVNVETPKGVVEYKIVSIE